MEFVLAAIALAPKLIALGEDLAPLATRLYDAISGGKVPSQEDWDWLNAKSAELDARLHKRAQDAAGG